MKEFIVSKGINVTGVKKLTTYEQARTNTFKVSIKASDYDKAIKPEVWPLRVGVRLFRQKRSTQSWAQQSAATGGNVQTTQSYTAPGQELYGVRSMAVGPPLTTPLTPISTSNRFSLLGNLGDQSAFHSQN